MKYFFKLFPVFALLFLFTNLQGQFSNIKHKCGVLTAENAKLKLANWGYSYNDLLTDIQDWEQSSFVNIKSIGKSVQNRDLWQLKITDNGIPDEGKRIISIHARTHPNEVQAWWVTNAMINQLLLDDPFSQLLRESCIFYIIPMYNPDGVELEYPRENSNNIDIESNWDNDPVEDEVEALRTWFLSQMNSAAPIEIALNMHSAFACKRYFVYHDVGGTNTIYTELEKDFITDVGSYYMDGIQPWDYYVSWSNSAPPYYPESWFWLNYGEDVLALTYEDMNCDSAGNYQQTAAAILNGISDQLGITVTASLDMKKEYSSFKTYPNPFVLSNNSTQRIVFEYELVKPQNINLSIFDNNGNLVKTFNSDLLDTLKPAGVHRIYFDCTNLLSSGIYSCVLQLGKEKETKRMIVVE